MTHHKWLYLFFLLTIMPTPATAQIRGDAAAVATAERLLEHAGGRAAWATARTFYTEQRSLLMSGEIAEQKIWRDFETGNRRIERSWPGGNYTEWLSAASGYQVRGDTTTDYSPEDLEIRLQGLKQEPYAVYRRLALRDPALRVQLRDENTLHVYACHAAKYRPVRQGGCEN